MADYQLLPGQGLMFNTHKRSDSYPDFKGQVLTPSGEVLNISGWFKTTKGIDTDYLSIKLTKPPQSEDNITTDDTTSKETERA